MVDAGNLILAVSNAYTGGTTVNNSTLTLSNITAAGTGTITLTNNATLVLKTAGTVQYNNQINVAAGTTNTISVPNTGAALLPEMNGPFTGSGTVIINMDTVGGTIAQTPAFGTNGMANFNGTIKIADNTTNGYVRFYPNIGANAGINGSSGCLFDLGTNSTATGAAAAGVRFFDRVGNPIDLIGALAGGPTTLFQGAGSATAIATTFVIGGKNINATYYGSIQDGAYSPVTAGNMVSVTKVGTGTQTLAGTNTYSGPTIVSNGVLQINGSISTNSVTVSGGTLGGSGTIGGAVTNQTGGTLAPGAGNNVAGTVLTLNSNLTLQVGGTTIMQAVHGASPDQIVSAGTVTYGGLLLINTNGDSTAYEAGDSIQLFNSWQRRLLQYRQQFQLHSTAARTGSGMGRQPVDDQRHAGGDGGSAGGGGGESCGLPDQRVCGAGGDLYEPLQRGELLGVEFRRWQQHTRRHHGRQCDPHL